MNRGCGASKRPRDGSPGGRSGSGVRGRTNRRARAHGGFTLVEVALASVVLIVALGGLTGAILSGLKLSHTNAENARAEAELRMMLAEIQSLGAAAAYATYNEDPGDDLGGPGTAPGSGFEVENMTPVEGDPDGLAGEVIFPASWNGPELELREDTADPAFNMPRDLNGDGDVDEEDHSEDFVILPVRVRIRWTGASGPRSAERSMLLVR